MKHVNPLKQVASSSCPALFPETIENNCSIAISHENYPKNSQRKHKTSKLDPKVSDKENLKHLKSRTKKVTKKAYEMEKGDCGPQDMIKEQNIQPDRLEKQVSELSNISESKSMEIAELKIEVNRLKDQLNVVGSSQFGEEMQSLHRENRILKDRLEEMEFSCKNAAISDTEKEILQRSSSGSELSLTGAKKEQAFCTLEGSMADWDKASNSSMSEMSVACLQDRIIQMEETHYSTNEELQATLQELTDLQDQLTDLQHENERINDEKAVLLESLCSQTDELDDCRAHLSQLRDVLLNRCLEGNAATEQEKQLVQLVTEGREEQERLQHQLRDVGSRLTMAQRDHETQIAQHQDRVQFLESSLEAAHADKKLLEKQNSDALEQISAKQLKLSQLKTQLSTLQQKASELERERDGTVASSELDKLLREARQEKERLECQAMKQQEQLASITRESERLKESIVSLQEENIVTRNNAKKQVSDMEYKLEKAILTKQALEQDLKEVENALRQNESKMHSLLEEKRQMQKTLAEIQNANTNLSSELVEVNKELENVSRKHHNETEEWKKFQSDLLIAVRVANEFKTEAQHEAQKLVSQHQTFQDKIKSLEHQVEVFKTKQEVVPLVPSANSVLSSLEHRQTKQQSTVRSLIQSIESSAKQVKGPNFNPSNSTASSNSTLISNMENIINKTPLRQTNSDSNGPSESSRFKRQSLSETKSCGDSEVDHPRPMSILASKLEPARRNSYGDLDKKDPLLTLIKGGGSKRNALLKWCQSKTAKYKGIDLTNFSSSWNDGLALCALLHTYLPNMIPYSELDARDKRHNFALAFKAAESVDIPTTLNLNEMLCQERPDWQAVMTYVTAIYKHFEA